MLQKLTISNYAIIDHLTLEPDGGLNTVTGETGAGKSIILGALSLILGERADTSVLINKEQKCVVEACFDVSGNALFKAALRQEDIDEDDQCIIRREIASSGKSRAFVNDSPVTLSVLNRLTSLLVDLHQQFGHLALEDDQFQMDVIDAIAGTNAARIAYQDLYNRYRRTLATLAEQEARQLQWQKESDYKQFLYDELVQAGFREEEIEQAEQQLKQLNHAERILSVLQTARFTLEEGDQPVVNEVKKLLQQLQGITDVMPELGSLHERLSSVHAELKDIEAELGRCEGSVLMDPALMQTLNERVDLGYKLFKKHGVQDTAGLLRLQQGLAEELQETLNLSETFQRLAAEKDELYGQLMAEGSKLSRQRKKIVPATEARVNELLRLVGMPNAVFRIEVSAFPEPGALGLDQVSFLLDANKSGSFQQVYKAASGGEMSRIMLCIKSLTAMAMHLPTLIFDEVDTGISGEAARQVGILLHSLSAHHQVICITHQPQVAARGSSHFFVYKDWDEQKRITTRVRALQSEERVLAIAQMIGGESPSEAALQNARELVS